MPRRECIEQGCRRLHGNRGPRCSRCEEANYRTTTERGLGHEHRKLVADLLADSPPCYWCGAPATTGDHLVPRSHGGQSIKENYVAACERCNKSRGNRDDWSPYSTE